MRTGVLVVLSLAVAAACGGGQSDDSDSPATPAPAPAVTEQNTAASTGPATTVPVETPPTSSLTPIPSGETGTTQGPETTESVENSAIELLAAAISDPSRTDLELFAPLSPAYVYYEGLVLLTEHGDPVPPARITMIEGGFQLRDDSGPGPRFADFVFDAEGRVADFAREGLPVSTTVVGLGYEVSAGDLAGTVHSVRQFGADLQVIMVTTNASTDDSAFYVDSYVTADGRQLNAMPTTSLSNTVYPGATVAYIYVVEGADFGGTLYGQLGGGDGQNFVYADVEVQVPAPAGG